MGAAITVVASGEAILLAPILAGAALFLLLFILVDDRRARVAFSWAIVGAVLLALGQPFLQLCGLGENRADPYPARCRSSIPDVPLAGIPVLFVLAALSRRWDGGTLWTLGALVTVAAIAIPWFLLFPSG